MNKRQITIGALAALALGVLGPARSQDATQPVLLTQTPQGITAAGHSELKEKPDVARVTLTVTTNARNSAQSVQQNAERTTAVLAGLQGIGIAGKDIETLSYTVQPTFDYSESPPKRKGYQVQNSVQVTVHDLTKVGLVIDTVTAEGSGAEIGDVSFDLSDRAQAQADALAQAVASAKRKAGVMASAAGVDLGRLLSITEGAEASPPGPIPLYAPRSFAAIGQATPTPIAAQQITIVADATLLYAMGAAK